MANAESNVDSGNVDSGNDRAPDEKARDEKAVDVEEVKRDWVGHKFDSTQFRVHGDRMLAWAQACGETDPRFVDPDHADFQAHPTYTAQFGAKQIFPKGFPKLGRGGFDAGKAVEVHRPVRAGETLTGDSEIHDIYTKTGRSGTMIFIVHRMTFSNEAGEPVSTVDWRIMRSAKD
jgi:acyl dehydratase